MVPSNGCPGGLMGRDCRTVAARCVRLPGAAHFHCNYLGVATRVNSCLRVCPIAPGMVSPCRGHSLRLCEAGACEGETQGQDFTTPVLRRNVTVSGALPEPTSTEPLKSQELGKDSVIMIIAIWSRLCLQEITKCKATLRCCL